MLTIFGKKKKDENATSIELVSNSSPDPSPHLNSSNTSSSSPPNQNQNPSPNPPNVRQFDNQSTIAPQPQPATRAAPSPPPVASYRPPPPVPLPEEETSLTKLLQSLMQDIPISPDNVGGFSGVPQSTPDYVPVRNNPTSRPMVIGPSKDSSEWEEQSDQPGKPSTNAPTVTPPRGPSMPAPLNKPSTPLPPVTQKPTDKQSKTDKQPEKVAPPPPLKKEPRPPQSFDHIFQLTQGNLENTGLVIVNGEPGSGRTTLCSGLVGNYMKMGSPCLYLTCDQAPSNLRDQMKKLGTDAATYESQFRFLVIDGYASQSESFSMEPYYLDSPFSFDNITDTLVRNSGIFAGEKIRVIFDSLDKLAAKVQPKDFKKGFEDLTSKLKDVGCTFIATVDLSQLPKDLAGSLNDLADCVVDLSKDKSDPNGRQLEVQRVNRSASKIDPETFEIDSTKGLVFV
jgi:KaiC/GvpD/RAD55 family RecA-like ATPase